MKSSFSEHDDAIIEPLTRREIEILKLLSEKLTDPEIAQKLTLGLTTVKWHARQIYAKLGVNNRAQAVARAAENGLLDSKSPAAISPRHNLPRRLSSFIGREKEIAQIVDLLQRHALVTVIGAGGVGKTSLAVQAAEKLIQANPGGIWLVDLAPVSDPHQVAPALAAVLELKDPFTITTRQIIKVIASAKALLILDNCEHLIRPVSELACDLLHGCPRLSILATSREVLGLEGEMLFRCPSLALPLTQPPSDLEEIASSEALRLFVDRARLVRPDFTLDETNASCTARICRRLDGIPLAIELAAARLRVLSLTQIESHLGAVFQLLTGGFHTEQPRHQTLRALIDWSYCLLSDKERLLLARLTVFSGGWTLEAVEQVGPDPSGGLITAEEVIALLAGLADKSMIQAAPIENGMRYSMLETIRQYALEKLPAEETAPLNDRHLAYFLHTAERLEPELNGQAQLKHLDALEAELENLHKAMEWGLQSDPEAELRLATALFAMWEIRSRVYEGAAWLERGITRARTIHVRPEVMAKALKSLGHLSLSAGDILFCRDCLEESLAIYRRLGDCFKRETAATLFRLSQNLIFSEDFPRGVELAREALALAREVNDPFLISECLFGLSQCLIRQDCGGQEAVDRMQEGLAIWSQMGNLYALASGYFWLGIHAFNSVNLPLSRSNFMRGMDYSQQVGDTLKVAESSFYLGMLAALNGDHFKSLEWMRKAVHTQSEMGSGVQQYVHYLLAYGMIALILGKISLARRNFEEALTVAEKHTWRVETGMARYFIGELAWVGGDAEQARIDFDIAAVQLQAEFHYWRFFTGLEYLRCLTYAWGDDCDADSILRAIIRMAARRKGWADAARAVEGLARRTVKSNPERAARLFGIAESMNPYLLNLFHAAERADRADALARLRTALGAARLAVLWTEGKTMKAELGAQFALEIENDRAPAP
jgi:predicted ATPase/DNA-binding CsgD family transcriptional regulator